MVTKKMKLFFIIILLFIGINCVNAFDNTAKVYDYAQVLTPSEELELKTNINKYIQKNSMDMVLVTVKHHTQKSTSSYTQEFYKKNKFGVGENLDGIIFVLDFSLEDINIHIEPFGNAIKLYDNNRVKSLSQDILRKKDKGYFKMCDLFVRNSYNYAKEGIPTGNSNNTQTIVNNLVLNKPIPWIFISIISFIISTIIIIILIFKNKMIKKSTNANYYLKKDSIVINISDDDFITTDTTSVRINASSEKK